MFPLLATLSSVAYSLSFGEAKARSTQGQVLQVRVALNDARGHELFDVDVEQILGAKARELGFAGAASDPAYSIELMSNGHGDLWIDVSSDQPFTEPYAQFLLQLDSSDERLLSEYRVSVPSAASQATYLIKPGDSLGRIAQAIRPDEAIQLQAIVRYLHANNLQAFAQGDINRIVVGARLSLPSASDYSAMPRRDLKPAPAVAVIEKPESVAVIEKSSAVSAVVSPYAVEPLAAAEETEQTVDAVEESEVAEIEWVELGAVEAPEQDITDNSQKEAIEFSASGLSTNKATVNSAAVEAASKPLKPSTTALEDNFYYSFIAELWWLLIALVVILLAAIFIARHHWRFAKKSEAPKNSAPCEKTARVLALEKKLARQQAYKKNQAEKQLAARERVRELEEKLAKIQRKKKPPATKAVKSIEQAAVNAQSLVIEPNTELSQVTARADLSVNPAEVRAPVQSKPAKKSSPVVKSVVKAVPENNPLAQSPRKRDADDEQVIDDFYKLLDRD